MGVENPDAQWFRGTDESDLTKLDKTSDAQLTAPAVLFGKTYPKAEIALSSDRSAPTGRTLATEYYERHENFLCDPLRIT
mgnify:CR=1 FL=1